MTYDTLYENYLAWIEVFHGEPKDNIEQNLLCIREIESTPETLIMESFHAEGIYTDRLHLFLFSVYTSSKKNHKGDLMPQTQADYTILEKN